ncbi:MULTISPECIES: hypothetical protein [unclassified Shewanella]|uniref:hypothetical protein n=1 Tax=unclassified Shewanella TaxID=196818 RepID=UPI001BBBBEC8|nr:MULTISPECIES: hypothetical protein [unclassified Shewanella]GIU20235.1 hypothetical protein TUM4444_37790 [Shewanella sp. MBTL60-112-B1]GIU38651.1 hypothetical protein TUM4445_33130 [Shewanella sp. MBTL60-112-B2]
MGMAELSIIGLVLAVVVLGYFSIYPKLAGNDFNKISLCDIASSSFVMILVGLKYWGSGYDFSLLFFSANWFWFTFIVYAVIEVPIAVWYFKKHAVVIDIKK